MRRFLLFLILIPLSYASLQLYWRAAQRRAVIARIQQFASPSHSLRLITPHLHNGDLIFHTSLSAQSRAIQLATRSPYSHCGVLFKRGKEWRVFEAVQPVGETSLAAWVARGKNGHFVAKRLRDAEHVLTPTVLRKLQVAGEQYRGRNYDLYFGWSDDRMYCSELLWKMYSQATGRRIGQLQKLREFDLSHPAVQAKLRERYGRRLPLDEQVISPVRMLESEELVTVK